MAEYEITLSNGDKYSVEGDSPEKAHEALTAHLIEERKAASKKAYDDAPFTSKMRMAIGDPLDQIAHGLTAGLFDKAFDKMTGSTFASDQTQASADRMGPAATTAARVGGAVMLPSGAPAAVARVGGGPLVRGLVGGGVAAGEGATYGGVNAATSGEDIPTGILAGGVGGAAGQVVGNAVGKGTNKVVKLIRGVDDAAPPRNITTLPSGRTPSAKDLVDVAAARAASKGRKEGTAEATQAAQRDNFEKLLTGPDKGKFTPVQRDRMGKIVYGDPGTKAAEVGGEFLSNKLLATGLGIGTGFGSGGIIPGLLTSGAALGTGKALAVDSAKATQEAVDSLRQLLYKKQPFKGPMSPRRIRQLGQGFGYLGREGTEDYLSE